MSQVPAPRERHPAGAGDPIRVGEISPGFVETGFAAHYHKSAAKAQETYSQFTVLTADDVAEIVGRYRKLLEQLDEPFPSPFVLDDILARAGPGE